jgi:hypothetical protein
VHVALSWLDKVRGLSLQHLYMVERMPDRLDEVPPHQLWQAPFVLAPLDEPWDTVARRVRLAGELWLVNQDFRPYNELIVAHVDRPWFMAFQRGARPDEGDVFIGPLAARVIRPSDAKPLWSGFPLCFREAEQATGGDLWRKLARSVGGRA